MKTKTMISRKKISFSVVPWSLYFFVTHTDKPFKTWFYRNSPVWAIR